MTIIYGLLSPVLFWLMMLAGPSSKFSMSSSLMYLKLQARSVMSEYPAAVRLVMLKCRTFPRV